MRQPNPEILLKMFGDDKPIGYFAERRFEEDLRNAGSFEAKIEAIAVYAIALHEDQADYEDISPFGGEDIDVIPVLEIASSTAEKIFHDEKFEVPLYVALLKNGGSDVEQTIKRKITDFERRKEYLNGGLEKSFYKIKEKEEVFLAEAKLYVKRMNTRGVAIYDDARLKVKELQKKPLRQSLLRRKYDKLEQSLEDTASEGIAMAELTLKSLLSKDRSFELRYQEISYQYPNSINNIRRIDTKEKLEEYMLFLDQFVKTNNNEYQSLKQALANFDNKKEQSVKAALARLAPLHSEGQQIQVGLSANTKFEGR